jgi:hypothetical protein
MSFSSPRDRALFLSYARADESDDGFIQSLHQKLGEAGYATWWDRVDMPSRGLAFMHEIRRAIDGARRLLVVLGPRVAESEYVRAEWQHALATSKIVIPLLRAGGADTVPPELRPLHFVDVRPERPFNDAWAELLRQVSAPDPALGELFGRIPELPPHHRPRPHLTGALADGILGDLAGR